MHSVEISWFFYHSDFYVKSILGDSRSAKYAILTHVKVLNFDFYGFLHILKPKFTKLTKFRAPKIAKRQLWNLQILQSWFHVKSTYHYLVL